MRQLTADIVWAAVLDHGNNHMRKNGRTQWDESDFNAAWDEFDRLWPLANDVGGKCDRMLPHRLSEQDRDIAESVRLEAERKANWPGGYP